MFDGFLHDALSFFAALLIFGLGVLALYVLTLYIIDIRQTQSTIRRNYPVIGRFRYFFEHLGTFFRQYFFALDREELPFNRALRSWIYRAAKGVSCNIAFGSTRNMNAAGEPHFLNAAFPPLEDETERASELIFGADSCSTPYHTRSFFNISGMSYGSISSPAVKALSRGAAQAGCWLNTGEGGLSPYHLEANADIVFQIGTAKYGARDKHGALCDERLKDLASKPQVRMFELKLSQGAKPGKGGILPANKVTSEIAAIRGIPEGETSISPNRHPDITSNQELLETLNHIRDVTGKPVGFKFVMGDPNWISGLCQTLLQEGKERAPDFITLDSADGGTGAAPQPLMDYMGLPLKESLLILVDTLTQFGLRDRIKIVTSGKLITPAFVSQALAIGADVVVSARGFMFALGCIQALQCNQNTCPTGITTHDKRLQKGLDPTNKGQRVANYHKQMLHDVEMIAHSCGLSHAQALNRTHIKWVNGDGRACSFEDIHPTPIRIQEKSGAAA